MSAQMPEERKKRKKAQDNECARPSRYPPPPPQWIWIEHKRGKKIKSDRVILWNNVKCMVQCQRVLSNNLKTKFLQNKWSRVVIPYCTAKPQYRASQHLFKTTSSWLQQACQFLLIISSTSIEFINNRIKQTISSWVSIILRVTMRRAFASDSASWSLDIPSAASFLRLWIR